MKLANNIKIIACQHIKSIVKPDERSDMSLPEISFIGRSNVGKSSLINRLLMKRIARTGSTPGVTKVINLYKVQYQYDNTKNSVVFSDFPGFGYARVSKKTYDEWKGLVETYFDSNRYIKLIAWVFDIRREMDHLDAMLHNWLKDKDYEHIFVLTKIDKMSKNDITIRKRGFLSIFNEERLFLFSSKDGTGREEILSYIVNTMASC
ncbi:MAG: ribosome biogenesis GTP-binding protein YihA/YsxC [Syntrophorhabdaceae bacterium]|nr:ribosome biogenesis GTP-binding protein YihA/YsxC [Syntrophorhabdaceae bacterium]